MNFTKPLLYGCVALCMLEAMKGNVATSRHTQAEVEEELSQYLINARDRKGGRKERENRRKQQFVRASSTPQTAEVTATSSVSNSAISDNM